MSQRVLIVGVSESGKSGLARKLVAESGLPFYVRDPIGTAWENARLVTSDMAQFILAVEAAKNEPRIAVIDEAGEVLKVGDYEHHKTFTRWRHDAILPIAIAQRIRMIAPTVRVNATDVYIFESHIKDCEVMSEDYNCDGIMQAAEFEAGEFLHFRKEDGKKVLTYHKLF